ncbi:MAG: MBL fold metallo-hydrolase [Actinomycetes bacterium]
MTTTIDEVGDRIYRVSTYNPMADMVFNQILIDADEPLLFHLGQRALFADVSAAVARVVPLDRLRWLGFGHVEADENGSMNEWLAAAPNAEVAFGFTGSLVSVMDLADRPPRMLTEGETIDLGGRTVRYLDTPHVPHGWDAGLLFEETTGTLLCGDLFTRTGEVGPTSTDSPLAPALEAEAMFGSTARGPQTGPTLERLAALEPAALALMHGATHTGDAATWLRELAAAMAVD